MTSISAIFSIWTEPSLIVLSGFTMPLPIPLRSWGYLALMPKLFVVLWGRLSKVVLRPAFPKTKFLRLCRYTVSYYKEKGIHEAQLFPQIVDLLEELLIKYPLYITTTKKYSNRSRHD